MDNPYGDKATQSGHPAVNDLDWDKEIDPYDMWGVYEDLKDELSGDRVEDVQDYMT